MRGYTCARLRSPLSMPPTPGMSLCVSCVSGVVGGGLSVFFVKVDMSRRFVSVVWL